MKKPEMVKLILGDRCNTYPQSTVGKAFAPSNIALCKYWGKRDQELNLPVTSSLSISLGNHGAMTSIAISPEQQDSASLNGQSIDWTSAFGKRLSQFLNLFRVTPDLFFNLEIQSTIPIGAGLASSACGFASLVLSLNELFGWQLTDTQLSILSRLGSGSASRSLWHGFVEWQAGVAASGIDSFSQPIAENWPELCVGLLIFSHQEKKISSRDAMQRTVATSPLYSAWPAKVEKDLAELKQAIRSKDFLRLGTAAESNALSMHATMLSAWPPVSYAVPETIVAMQKIWELREQGLSVFFTQDAGPNLKLLFLEKDRENVKKYFPDVEVINPFAEIFSARTQG